MTWSFTQDMKEPRKMFNLFKERSKEHTFVWNKGKLKRIGNGDKTGFSVGWRESNSSLTVAYSLHSCDKGTVNKNNMTLWSLRRVFYRQGIVFQGNRKVSAKEGEIIPNNHVVCCFVFSCSVKSDFLRPCGL